MSDVPQREMTLDEYMRAWENADSRHQAVRDYNALRTRLASLEAENERLRPPAGHDGTTHWETCWQTHGHHACAIARVQRAEQRVAELERVVEAAKRLLRSELGAAIAERIDAYLAAGDDASMDDAAFVALRLQESSQPEEAHRRFQRILARAAREEKPRPPTPPGEGEEDQ